MTLTHVHRVCGETCADDDRFGLENVHWLAEQVGQGKLDVEIVATVRDSVGDTGRIGSSVVVAGESATGQRRAPGRGVAS